MTEYYETVGTIRDGFLKVHNRKDFETALAQWADGDVIVRIERPEAKRTSAQNRFWHGIVIPAFAEHCGYRFEEMKAALALKLIPQTVRGLDGVERVIPGHTSALSVTQFTELIERAQQLGAEMEIYIPDPGEVAA